MHAPSGTTSWKALAIFPSASAVALYAKRIQCDGPTGAQEWWIWRYRSAVLKSWPRVQNRCYVQRLPGRRAQLVGSGEVQLGDYGRVVPTIWIVEDLSHAPTAGCLVEVEQRCATQRAFVEAR